ncbi:hypothetical protein LZ30DRAFT_11150 [Colletotrichum cereale]|nr:hypothetical protein LZ30DRAFT_11150 [Colletotrichum cereale]
MLIAVHIYTNLLLPRNHMLYVFVEVVPAKQRLLCIVPQCKESPFPDTGLQIETPSLASYLQIRRRVSVLIGRQPGRLFARSLPSRCLTLETPDAVQGRLKRHKRGRGTVAAGDAHRSACGRLGDTASWRLTRLKLETAEAGPMPHGDGGG